MMYTGKEFNVTEVGYFRPGVCFHVGVKSGDVYIAASIKNVRDTRVGDTITSAEFC